MSRCWPPRLSCPAFCGDTVWTVRPIRAVQLRAFLCLSPAPPRPDPIQVMARRGSPAGGASSALRQLARDCTEQPLVQRAARRGLTRLDQWNRDLPLAPLA